MQQNIPRLVIAAPQSGSGKTTVSMGIMDALMKRGFDVRPFKVGPDYIDTAYHSRICAHSAINLDVYLLGETELCSLFVEYSAGGVSIIEGVMGLFDGLGSTSFSSTAHVATLLSAPVVLVLNARGMSASAAAVVKGCMEYDKQVNVAAVIFNNVSSVRHYSTLKEAVERDCGIKVLGYFPRESAITIDSRHLGIIPQFELERVDERICAIRALAEQYIDIYALLSIADSAPSLDFKRTAVNPLAPCTLAVAMDKVFNFYYADNLELLKRMGVKIVYFSPLLDAQLPDADGVYIGGGFPEVFAAELENNSSMRASIRAAAQTGVPLYAECGGYMYLMDNIVTVEGNRHAMCGVFRGEAVLGEKLSGQFGYVEATLLTDTIIGKAGTSYKAHEFHHSYIDTPQPPTYSACKAAGSKPWTGGSATKNAYGTYAHVYFRSDPSLVRTFIEACLNYSYSKVDTNT